jgi:hypothetical protein
LFSLGFPGRVGGLGRSAMLCKHCRRRLLYDSISSINRLRTHAVTLTARRFDFDVARVNRACTTLDSLSCAHASDGGFHLAGFTYRTLR